MSLDEPDHRRYVCPAMLPTWCALWSDRMSAESAFNEVSLKLLISDQPLRLTTSIVLPREGLRISSPQTFDMLASLRTLLTTYRDILRHSTLPTCGSCCAIVTRSRAMLLTWCAPSRDRALPSPRPERNSDPLWIVVIVVAKERILL